VENKKNNTKTKEQLLNEAARNPTTLEVTGVERLENGHYEVTFADNRTEEVALVQSSYKTLFSGDCNVYLPPLAGLTPKKYNLMLAKTGGEHGQSNLNLIGPRLTVGNSMQLKAKNATLVCNYYAEVGKDQMPLFQINDPAGMRLGKKVTAKVFIRLKENEKGNQIIIDCYVYSYIDCKEPKTNLLLCVQKNKPEGFKVEYETKIVGEDRKVFVCKR